MSIPMLENELGELDEQHREFVAVCEICDPQSHMDAYRWPGNGCPPNSRLAMCKAFIAKSYHKQSHQSRQKFSHLTGNPDVEDPDLEDPDLSGYRGTSGITVNRFPIPSKK
jgi:hypothetical protein